MYVTNENIKNVKYYKWLTENKLQKFKIIFSVAWIDKTGQSYNASGKAILLILKGQGVGEINVKP